MRLIKANDVGLYYLKADTESEMYALKELTDDLMARSGEVNVLKPTIVVSAGGIIGQDGFTLPTKLEMQVMKTEHDLLRDIYNTR